MQGAKAAHVKGPWAKLGQANHVKPRPDLERMDHKHKRHETK